MKKFARHAIFYVGLLAIWALLAKLKVWPPYVFPSPWGVLEALVAGFKDHSFWIAIAVSMKRMLLGYALSVVLGMILGLGVASNKFLEETMGGLLVSLQSLPSICWRCCCICCCCAANASRNSCASRALTAELGLAALTRGLDAVCAVVALAVTSNSTLNHTKDLIFFLLDVFSPLSGQLSLKHRPNTALSLLLVSR